MAIKKSFFQKKITKNRQAAGCFALRQAPSVICLSSTSLLNTSPNLDIFAFYVLNLALLC